MPPAEMNLENMTPVQKRWNLRLYLGSQAGDDVVVIQAPAIGLVICREAVELVLYFLFQPLCLAQVVANSYVGMPGPQIVGRSSYGLVRI